ncbi:MAG: hypothetical protein ACKUBY_03670 [Candidatus Moraniibacteriota bacterium]
MSVYQFEGDYVGIFAHMFVHNCIILIVIPVIAIIGMVSVYLTDNVFANDWLGMLFGAIGIVCYIVASIIFPLVIILEDDLDIGLSLKSWWSKMFVGGLSIIVGVSIVTISSFICWDAVIMDDVSSGIVVEWISYLASCFVCLPLSIVLAKSVFDSLRQKILT